MPSRPSMSTALVATVAASALGLPFVVVTPAAGATTAAQSQATIRQGTGWLPTRDQAGNLWEALGGRFDSTRTATAMRGRDIEGTVADALYGTTVWGMTSYRVAVAPGTYTVKLYLAEDHVTGPGKRVFDVTAEGATALPGVDVFAATGGQFRAYEPEFTTTVADGVLDLGFQAKAGDTVVSAIEITPTDNAPSPAPDPTPAPQPTAPQPFAPTPAPTPEPTQEPTQAPTPARPAPVTGAPAWPIRVSGDGSHLEDTNGAPFLLVGDTAWAMLHGLSVEQAKRYIDIRKSQGFNTLLTNMVFRERSAEGPRGTPFVGRDLRQPNEAYFAGIDDIVAYARQQGMTLYVGMMWFANNGGWDGGVRPSLAEARTYGAYLARRYGSSDNLIWFAGGDDSGESWYPFADALAEGFRSVASAPVISYHNQSSAPQMRTRAWHGMYSFQWNGNTSPYPYSIVREHTTWSPRRPVLDMEPAYDPTTCCSPSDPHTTAQKDRRQDYWALLSGATGVVYGGPRETWDVGFSSGWAVDEGALNRQNSKETATAGAILAALPWASLEPDWAGDVVTGDRGTYGSDDYVAAARAADGGTIVAYTPVRRDLTVDLSTLSGPGTARWLNPATGDVVASESVTPGETRRFANPLGEDALLVITR